MSSLISIVLLIFILGIIILVHELGHFYFAKKYGVHIYEFSLGMGPVIYSKLGKDKIKYNIRAIPIGGFVNMAGEVFEDDEEQLEKNKYMCNKLPYQRFIILVAGVINNFILAIIIFFISTLILGGMTALPVVKDVKPNYPFSEVGIKKGDKIIRINNQKITNWDKATLVLLMKHDKKEYEFVVENKDGVKTHLIEPKTEKINGQKVKTFGVELEVKHYKSFFESIKYSFIKFSRTIEMMSLTIKGLFTGKIDMNSLAGPIGMYKIVEESKTHGIANLLYLTAFLSINVGFINILPFPAFDGGRVLFLVIEKIRKKPVNAYIENIMHVVGFFLLIGLMIYVSILDIIKLF